MYDLLRSVHIRPVTEAAWETVHIAAVTPPTATYAIAVTFATAVSVATFATIGTVLFYFVALTPFAGVQTTQLQTRAALRGSYTIQEWMCREVILVQG